VDTAGEIVLRIAELRAAHRSWGAKKLRVLLVRERGEKVPSVKTIARILERLGEPRLRRVRSHSRVAREKREVDVASANDLWTVDFKGWWRTHDGKRCEPLTVRDAFSRFVLSVRVMSSTALAGTQQVFLKFQAARAAEGHPCRQRHAFRLHRRRGRPLTLSAWWCLLGVDVVFGRPAHPQDNGAHERMLADMALELERDAASNSKAQQRACDLWVHEFNHVRPHEALEMRTPAELYSRSKRPYRGPRATRYPIAFDVRRVFKSGAVKFDGKEVYVGAGFATLSIGIERVVAKFVRLWFYERDLGLVDMDEARSTRRAAKETAPASKKGRVSTPVAASETTERGRQRDPKRGQSIGAKPAGTRRTARRDTLPKRRAGTSKHRTGEPRSDKVQGRTKDTAKRSRTVNATHP
jgi:transposase InsO family protein